MWATCNMLLAGGGEVTGGARLPAGHAVVGLIPGVSRSASASDNGDGGLLGNVVGDAGQRSPAAIEAAAAVVEAAAQDASANAGGTTARAILSRGY